MAGNADMLTIMEALSKKAEELGTRQDLSFDEKMKELKTYAENEFIKPQETK